MVNVQACSLPMRRVGVAPRRVRSAACRVAAVGVPRACRVRCALSGAPDGSWRLLLRCVSLAPTSLRIGPSPQSVASAAEGSVPVRGRVKARWEKGAGHKAKTERGQVRQVAWIFPTLNGS